MNACGVLTPGIALGVALILAQPALADPLSLWAVGAPEGTAELAPGVKVQARKHACAACHGWDGSGGGEGAMRAPDLGRRALIAKGYNAEAFAAALEQGKAPDGRALSRAMPRFAVPTASVAALWDFTVPLDERRRYGVAPDRIKMIILHDPGQPASAALVRAYETTLKPLDGAFWGRQLAFVVEPMERAAALATDPTVFAVIGPFAPGPTARAALAAGQVPMLHGFGNLDAPGARTLPLGLERSEELAVLLQAVRDAGHGLVSVAGGDAVFRAEAERLIRRLGMQTGDGDVTLLLTSVAPVPDGATLAVPESVLLARPELAEARDLISVPTLPFLVNFADPALVYAETSVRILVEAIEGAGPDPTRASVTDAAKRLRDALLGGM